MNLSVKLKPLIIYCCPENGQFYPIEMSDMPAFFEKPEIAISYSSEKKGWARRLGFDFKVHTGNSLESFRLKLNTFDIIIAYPLSLNTMSKFSLGIQDSFPTALLSESAALGKPILLNDQFIPSLESHLNPHLIRTYRNHWNRLLSGTIKGFNLDNLAEIAVKILRNKSSKAKVSPFAGRTIITREDIILAADSLEPLTIPSNAIVTDLAKEEAAARGVVLLYS